MTIIKITAYEKILKSDKELRKIINDISDKQTLARIESFKANNQMLFYHVEKSQYLSKKFFAYANHKKNYIKLDAKEVRKRHDELRKQYEDFKTYKQNNATIFKDNTQYNDYLQKFHEYVGVSKEFYIRVKGKKEFTKAEQAIQQYLPASARRAIALNKDGSLSKLLKFYNNLVHAYNRLNM